MMTVWCCAVCGALFSIGPGSGGVVCVCVSVCRVDLDLVLAQALTHDPLEAAIEHTIEHNPSVLIPWEPPIRDQYEGFNYRELEQRLHSATLRAKELKAPSVYFRFLEDRDPSVRKLIDWLETRFPAGINLPHTLPTTSIHDSAFGNFTCRTCHTTLPQQCHKQETPITIGPMPQVSPDSQGSYFTASYCQSAVKQ